MAYGKSFIFIGGHGRSSSSATAGGDGGGLGIATGFEGATIREERGSGEEGGAPADIGRGGRSSSSLAGIDRGSRRVEIAKRVRGDVVGDRDQDAGIENSDRLLWEAGGRRRRRRFYCPGDESQVGSFFCGVAYERIPHAPVLELKEERAFFITVFTPCLFFFTKLEK